MRKTKWTEELIEEEIKRCMKALNINRMPTATELRDLLGRGDLHNTICRTRKYSGWAEKLKLLRKDSETLTGNDYEGIIGERLKQMGYEVERMTTKHPYDLMVDGVVKIDIKVSNLFKSRVDSEWWAFNLAKEKPTCDIYILVALAAEGIEERVFVIPSQFVNMKTVNVGRETKYKFFLDRFDFVQEFSNFYKEIENSTGDEWYAK